MDYIDTMLAEREQRQKHIWQAREWTIFCAKTIEAQAPDFWKDLLTAVEQLLEKIGLPSVALQKIPSGKFFVHQPKLPSVDVLTELDIPAHAVRITTTRRRSREVLPSKSEQRLAFHLDEAGELYLKHGDTILNVDDAARFLMQPFIG